VTDLGSMQSSPAAEMGGGGPAAANGPGSPGDDPDALTGHALLDWAKKGRWSRIVDSRGFLVVELAAIVLWAVYFTRPYLDMDPAIVPAGREYLSAIQTHSVWQRFEDCGLCGLWYGNVRGGFPAFADPVASTLHPLVIVTTLIWGIVNGSKVALVGVFALAGLSQWWLGHLLGLRLPSRLWGAAMAVVAGYLAARMELGAFSLVLSTASAVAVFPAMLYLTREMTWRGVIPLAVILALLAVGGTGYMQIGLIFVLPAAVFLVPLERDNLTRLVRRFAQAVGLAMLLAGPFLVPFVHFLPQIAKDFDTSFSNAQPLAYVPLNLVIRDITFYLSNALGKPPWPSHFVNFVGWIPVILAAYGVFSARDPRMRRAIAFLAIAAALALWTASSVPLAWLVKIVKLSWLTQLIGGIRYTSFIASLAVPPILGLSAIGLDRLLSARKRRFRLSLEGASVAASISLDVRWFLLVPLLIAVNQARTFSSLWIGTKGIDPYITSVVNALKTPGLEWVNVPFGEHFFVTPAIGADLKLSGDFFRTWHWKDRPIPQPVLEANRNGPPGGMVEQSIVEGIHIHAPVERQEYAAIVHADGSRTACTARGTGGDIDVSCAATQGGALVVEENSWAGWRAEVDGKPAELLDGGWLSVNTQEGSHTYAFRYRPWDVPLGIVLFVVGAGLSVWLAFRERRTERAQSSASPEEG